MQADLLSCSDPIVGRKLYSMSDVEEMMNLIESSYQITIHTWKLGTCNDLTEYELVKRAVLDALNNTEKFRCELYCRCKSCR